MSTTTHQAAFRAANPRAAQRLADLDALYASKRADLDGGLELQDRLRHARLDAEGRVKAEFAEHSKYGSGSAAALATTEIELEAEAARKAEAANARNNSRKSSVSQGLKQIRDGGLALERQNIREAIANTPRPGGAGTHVMNGPGARTGLAEVAFENIETSVKIPKGATLETVGEEIRSLTAEIAEVKSAPRPLDEALAKSLAAHNAGPLFEIRFNDSTGLAYANFPTETVNAEPGLGGAAPAAFDGRALTLAVAGDQVRAEVERVVREAYEDVGLTLTAAERAKRLKKLGSELLAAERIEVELVWQARARGEDELFRVGTDPRALLGVVSKPLQRPKDA